MKNSIKYFAIVLFILIAINVSRASEEQTPLYLFRDIRSMGLGNAFEAIADDVNALHYNPAGIAQAERIWFEFLLARTRITEDLSNEIRTATELFDETIEPIINSDEPLKDKELRDERKRLVEQLEETMNETLSAMSDIPAISLVVPYRISDKMNLAFGGSIYSQGAISTYIERRGLKWRDTVKDMLDNVVIYDVVWQVNIELATALKISVDKPFLKNACLGFDFKRINRRLFSDIDEPFTVADVLNPDGEDGIEGTQDDFSERYFDFEEQSIWEFVEDNFESQKGYTTDLGFLVTPLEGLKFAISVRNLVSNLSPEYGADKSFPRNTVYSTSVKPFVLAESIGLLENPSWFDFTLAASIDSPDGDDMLRKFAEDNYTVYALKYDNIHLGTELVIFPDRNISFSFWAGNNQGYTTLGTRLKLLVFNLSLARYSDLKANWLAGSIGISF